MKTLFSVFRKRRLSRRLPVFLIVVLGAVSCSKPPPPPPQPSLESLVGQTVDVKFCKGLWVACLGNPSNSGFILKSVEGDKVCLIDPTRDFIKTYNECLSKEYIYWQLIADDTFCVNRGEISQVSQNGSPVWGENSADCKGIERSRDR